MTKHCIHCAVSATLLICLLSLGGPPRMTYGQDSIPHPKHEVGAQITHHLSLQAGAGLSGFRFGVRPTSNMPGATFGFGASYLLLHARNFEFQLGADLQWYAGRGESYVQFHSPGGGQGTFHERLSIGLGFLNVRIPLLLSFRLPFSELYSMIVSAGASAGYSFMGRANVGTPAGRTTRDLRMGPGAEDHILPLDVGVLGQVAFRFRDVVQGAAWVEFGLLQRLPEAGGLLPEVTPEAMMRADFSAPALHSYRTLRTWAAGVTVSYLLRL